MKILIADDDAMNRKYLRTLLAQEGHTLGESEDGAAALASLERDPYDVLIADILMPRMDGYRLCYEIRQNKKLNSLPIILYTATYVDSADEKAAYDMGADRFIQKPAPPDVLLQAIDEVVKCPQSKARNRLKPPEALTAMREYSEALVRKLEEKNVKLDEANRTLRERAALAEFTAAISRGLIEDGTLRQILQRCAEAMAHHLEGAFARIWTLNPRENMLELQASAGMYTHIDGGHRRVPVGQFKIGLIASERKPHLTNSVIGDPRVHDQEWAKQEGMVAFAGYPLLVEDRVVGVMAMFSRKPLSDTALQSMSAVANAVAVGIERKQSEEEVRTRYQEIQTIQSIGQSVLDSLDLKKVLDTILERTMALAAFDTGVIALLDTGRDVVETAAVKGYRDSQNAPKPRRRAAEGLTGHTILHALTKNEIHIEENVSAAEGMRGAKKEGLQSTISIPVRTKDRVLGVLHLGSRAPRVLKPEEIRLLEGIGNQVGLALQKALLYRETNQALDRVRTLQEVGLAVGSTLDLRSCIDILLEKIDVLLPFPVATTIRLLNPVTRRFENMACRNIEEKEWKSHVGQGTRSRSDKILTTKRPVFVPNIQEEPGVSAWSFYRQCGLVSYLGVPLLVKDQVKGILGFYTKELHQFTEQEVDLLLTVAGQAAIAINNAKLYDDITLAKKELEITNQTLNSSLKQLDGLYTAMSPILTARSVQEFMSDIVDRLIEATGADAALVRLWDEETRNLPIAAHRGFSEMYLTRVVDAPLHGAVQWVFEHGEPIIAPDIAGEPLLQGKVQLQIGLRSCAILPVHVHGQIQGILHIASRVLGYFNQPQKTHLTAIARQMSIALENRRLFDDLSFSRDRLARANAALTESNRMLTALHAVAAAASQFLQLDGILRTAIQKITDTFHFDAAQIHTYDKQNDALCVKASFERDPGRLAAARFLKLGQGIVGTVAQTGKKMIFADVQTDPRYQQLSQSKISRRWGYRFFAAFPIESKARNLGTISCIGTDRRELTNGEIQLLEAISAQLAVAMENSELYHDVRDKVEDLQKKTSELEKANKVKDDFLGVISHELRTPLNVIMGYSSLLKDGVLGEIKPAQQDAVAKISRETRNLLEMINTLLFATTQEAGSLRIEAQDFSADGLLEELKAHYTVAAPQTVTMEWQYPADLPGLNTDRRKLKQVLDNLIGNAIKFTEQGTVTIAARLADPREQGAKSIGSASDRSALSAQPLFLEFTVTDTGIGIPGDKLDKIFDRFFQADSSDRRSFGGVGLGLYIAKKFTDLLGGHLAVASSEGVGSTFTLTIPLRTENGNTALPLLSFKDI